MATPSIAAAGSYTRVSSGTTSISLSAPAGSVAGSLLVVVLQTGFSANSGAQPTWVTPPAGWIGVDVHAWNDTTTSIAYGQYVFYKYTVSDESAASYTFTLATGHGVVSSRGQVLRVAGLPTGQYPFGKFKHASSTNTSTVSVPGFTPYSNRTLLIGFAFSEGDNTHTATAGWTKITEYQDTTSGVTNAVWDLASDGSALAAQTFSSSASVSSMGVIVFELYTPGDTSWQGSIAAAPYVAAIGSYINGGEAQADIEVPVPTGVVAGDLIVVAYEGAWHPGTPDSTYLTPSAGFIFAEVTSVYDTNAGTTFAQFWYYKYATTTDTGTYRFTVTAASASIGHTKAVACIIRGGPASGNPFGAFQHNASATNTSTTVADFTPAGPATLLLGQVFYNGDDDPALAGPANWSKVTQYSQPSTPSDEVAVSLWANDSAATATGALSWTISDTATSFLASIAQIAAPPRWVMKDSAGHTIVSQDVTGHTLETPVFL